MTTAGGNVMPIAGRNDGIGKDCDDHFALRLAGAKWQPVLPLMAAVLGCSGPRPSRASVPIQAEWQSVELVVYGPDGRAVPDAEVTYTCGQSAEAEVALTDRFGKAVLLVPANRNSADAQLLVEAKGFWGRRIHSPVLHPITPGPQVSNAVSLSLIGGPAVDSPPWGIEAMGLDSVSAVSFLGAPSAKCALIIAEVGIPKGGAPVVFPPADAVAEGAGKPKGAMRLSDSTIAMTGLLQRCAPEAEVTVLPLSVNPASRDMVVAIDWCIAQAIDVACLCFASLGRDDAVQDALKRAKRAGLLLICPSGDSQAGLTFPATSDQVVTVAAIGHAAACPKESAHGALNGQRGPDGYCLSNLTVWGVGIDMVAPGIAFLAKDQILSGSTFAAIHVAAFALCLLQSDEVLHRAPRTSVRLLELGASLGASCMDLGFTPAQQGAGMPVWGMKGRTRKSPEVEAQLARSAQAAMDLIAQGLS